MSPQDVEDSRSAARWRVEDHGWKELCPELPDEVIALLASPVVVSAETVRTPPPPARPVRMLAPAPPPRRRRGRQRRPAALAR